MLKCEYCHKPFKVRARGRRNPRFCSSYCQHKNWENTNRERARELWRNAYYRDRKSKIIKAAKWNKAHPWVNKRCVQNWSRTKHGKELNVAKTKRYRARKAGAEGTHTRKQFLVLLKLFKHICPKCGRKLLEKEFTEDHIVPLSKGGSNWISNIQPLCNPCNAGKGDKAIDYRPNYLEVIGDEP